MLLHFYFLLLFYNREKNAFLDQSLTDIHSEVKKKKKKKKKKLIPHSSTAEYYLGQIRV